MNRLMLVIVAAVSALAVMHGPVAAQPACETNYTGPTGGLWTDPGNWSNGEPDSSKVACIPHDKQVLLDAIRDAEALWVKSQSGQQGLLTIQGPTPYSGILQIFEDSRVDGVVKIAARSVLQATGHTDAQGNYVLKIKGNGGRIEGIGSAATIRGRLGGNNGGTLVTFEPQSGSGATRAASLMVHGSLNIFTPIVNKAFVVADNQILLLSYQVDTRICSAGKNGNWVAEQNPTTLTVGTLVVDETVDGSGKWELSSHASALIDIKADCPNNSGPVIVKKGSFYVGDNTIQLPRFISTGDLTFESVSGSSPVIKVFDGSYAQFDN